MLCSFPLLWYGERIATGVYPTAQKIPTIPHEFNTVEYIQIGVSQLLLSSHILWTLVMVLFFFKFYFIYLGEHIAALSGLQRNQN